MKIVANLAAAVFSMGVLLAQQTGVPNKSTQTSYSGQTWVGLLVAASCPAPAESSRAMKQSELTVTDRVTTPSVDASGTRGNSKVNASPPSEPATRRDVPLTGDIGAVKTVADPGWQQAKRQARALAPGCRVSAATSQFALLLPNGRLLRFDDLANAGIVKQLPPAAEKKIYRVQVVGKIENNAIALDSIQI